jgi:hypothetical protein
MSEKRLIFTVTTGRSGTDYLARILDCVPGVASRHETKPNFVWVMRDAQTNPELARRFWIEQKLPAIAETPEPVYVETSHVVCKGFLEPLLELGHRPDLVLLRRPHREVAMSMYRLGTIPGRAPKGLKWYLHPDDPGVLELPGWQELHDYQICYWYCLEIERRRQHYESLIGGMGARVVSITLAELATLRGFMRLREELDLPGYLVGPRHWYRYFRRTNVRANTQAKSKRDTGLPDTAEALESEVDALVANRALSATRTADVVAG